MSVTIKQIKWDKIGSISIANAVDSLRFSGTGSLGCYSSQYNGSNYQAFDTAYDPLTGFFASNQIYNEAIANIISAWPVSFHFVYQTNTGVYIKYYGSIYTLDTWNTGSISTLDASGFNVAYSYRGTGGSKRFLKFGEFSFNSGFPRLGGFVDTGLYGPTSISRNGLYVTVSGDPADGQNRKTIKVFTSSNGSVSWPFTPIQLGNTIEISGTANIEVVKINNAGTRLVVYTFSSIYTYELISESWVERLSIATPASLSPKGISLSSEGDILVTRGDSAAVSYSWNSGSNSWQLVDETSLITPLSYYGSKIDISSDEMYMAVDLWPTTNSKAIEIYKSTITEVAYDAPVITPAQTFTIPKNRTFSGTVAMQADGLNRNVTSWSATGLPAGLSINASTGQITGTASTEGTFSASITATGPGGASTEAVVFSVVDNFPLYVGPVRGRAIYAGATQGKALYYGSTLLWNAPGWTPSTLPQNLLAFYRFNDAGGGQLSLADTSGNNRTLTNTGGVGLSSGLFQGAAEFTSTQSLSAAIPLNPAQPYTIALWVNVASLKNYFTLVAGSAQGTLNIHGDSSGGLSWNNAAAGDFSHAGFFASSQWQHCVFVRGASNAMSLYKNGTLLKTATGSTNYSQPSFFDIGNVRHMGGFQFSGKIDALGFWSRALTTAEIAQLYNNGVGMEI